MLAPGFLKLVPFIQAGLKEKCIMYDGNLPSCTKRHPLHLLPFIKEGTVVGKLSGGW